MHSKEIVFETIIICPFCNYEKEEYMSENSYQHFYVCENCEKLLRPKNDECCVFCSFGSVKCPPQQKEEIVKT